MIEQALAVLRNALRYVTKHPQIFFVLILLIVFPVLFLYTGQQFLDVGKANQNTLQQQRIGLMHDVLASLVGVVGNDPTRIQAEINKVASINPDLKDFMVLKAEGPLIVPIAALKESEIGVPQENVDLYRSASVRTDESIIFEYYDGEERLWDAYRALQTQDGELYFILTRFSLQSVDELFASRESTAYFSLVFVYCFIIALALWHIKLTDYRYLYIAAQKANETKDLFTNMMAHELRAPLTAIRGYASMLVEHATQEDDKKYATRIQESSERLIAMVSDLLDVARIQSGKLSVEKGECPVAEVVRVVSEELRVSASEKHIELKLEIGDGLHNAIADRKRLHQAVTNLVSNAIKYTKEGIITLSLEDKPAYVELRVKDTGMGISAEDQKKLFAPFFRVANAEVSTITGTGLGMWITKEMIELMGGTINVESIKGVGTHVVVLLPKVEVK